MAALKQNPHSCTQRQRFQTGFSIKENPSPPISTGYAYADSALDLQDIAVARDHLVQHRIDKESEE